MVFARNVKYHIKDGKVAEFNRTFANDVLPILKNQPGFMNEITLFNDGSGIGISMWRDRASAEKYDFTNYQTVLDKLVPLLVDKPTVETFDVGVSTLTH